MSADSGVVYSRGNNSMSAEHGIPTGELEIEEQPPQQALVTQAVTPPVNRPLYAAAAITEVLQADAYAKIGTIKLTEDQEDLLDEPLPDDEIDIRPDGLIYASHEYVRRRLNKVFGRMQWTLVPGSPLTRRPDTDPPEYFQRWVLFIKGVYVSEALASRTFYEKRPGSDDGANFMAIDDVAEAMKSDALRRCCKDLGIGTECWNRRFQERWKATYAETYTNNKGKLSWKRKDAALTNDADAGHKCPKCGKYLRKAKDRPQWYCWQKMGGCGETYPVDTDGSPRFPRTERPVEVVVDTHSRADAGGSQSKSIPSATVIDDVKDTITIQAVPTPPRDTPKATSSDQPAPAPLHAVPTGPKPISLGQGNLLKQVLRTAKADEVTGIQWIAECLNIEVEFEDNKTPMENLDAIIRKVPSDKVGDVKNWIQAKAREGNVDGQA